MKPKTFLTVAIVSCIALGFIANSGSSGGSDIAAGIRALNIQKCMGAVDRNMSLTEYSQHLRDQEARTGIDVERQQVMATMLAEQRHPGVLKRCAARYPA